MENTQRDQRVLFNVVNLSKSRSLFREGLTPVVRSTTRCRWQRMRKDHCFYYKSPLHRVHFVLSFVFCFDKEDERYHFTLAQPYSLSRVDKYLEGLKDEGYEYVREDVVAKTVDGRPLKVLTITNPKNLEGSKAAEQNIDDKGDSNQKEEEDEAQEDNNQNEVQGEDEDDDKDAAERAELGIKEDDASSTTSKTVRSR